MTIELEGHSFCLPATQIENVGREQFVTWQVMDGVQIAFLWLFLYKLIGPFVWQCYHNNNDNDSDNNSNNNKWQ